ncbi:MAG: FAD-dependent oxidoreductase, partial [Pseudomonadota bacterium]
MSETHDCDVVVVGGGIAGLTAANRSAQQGLKAVLLERGVDERYLCNTRYSGGVIHLAFRNVKDHPQELMEAINQATSGNADP